MTMKKIFLFITVTALITLPLFASAATRPVKSDIWNPSDILQGPLVICWGGPVNADGSPNPDACTSLCDLVSQILNVIYFVIAFIIWIIVPIDVAIGGIMYMLVGANPGMLAKAKTILLGAAWAIGITLCSYIIIATFVNVMGIAGVGGFNTAACTIVGG